MAEQTALDELWKSRHELAEGEVRIVEIARSQELRVRLLVTRKGFWPAHTDRHPETYVVLRGEVQFTTDRELTIGAGQMVRFEAGESHAARIDDGALSISIDVPEKG